MLQSGNFSTINMLGFYEIAYAFQISVVAVVAGLLMAQGEALEWYLDILIRLERTKLGLLAKPLGMCEKCLAGQLSLGLYLLAHWGTYYFNPVEMAVRTVMFVSFSILGTYLIKKWWI